MKPHEHKAEPSDSHIYEACKCGAVRKADRRGHEIEDWHICELCLLAGFILSRGKVFEKGAQ